MTQNIHPHPLNSSRLRGAMPSQPAAWARLRGATLALMLAFSGAQPALAQEGAEQTTQPGSLQANSPVVTVETGGKTDATAGAKGKAGERQGEAVAQLRRFSTTVRSASGRFVQTPLGSRQGASAASRGQFAFARPGNFRWEIESPDQQLIVTNGKKLYFYDKDLQQVTVRAADEAIQSTPAAVLFGVGDLNQAFTLSELGTHNGVAWVEAIPKDSDSGFERIRIGMKDGKPVAMEVRDAFSQTNRFQFSDLNTDAKLPASHFDFVPPKGGDVME